MGDCGWRVVQFVTTDDFIRCLKCRGQLLPSGVEVHRHICKDCGQNYHAVLQFVPVDPIQRAEGLLGSGDAISSPAPDGGDEVPATVR